MYRIEIIFFTLLISRKVFYRNENITEGREPLKVCDDLPNVLQLAFRSVKMMLNKQKACVWFLVN